LWLDELIPGNVVAPEVKQLGRILVGGDQRGQNDVLIVAVFT
jgi:hypothetical protein